MSEGNGLGGLIPAPAMSINPGILGLGGDKLLCELMSIMEIDFSNSSTDGRG